MAKTQRRQVATAVAVVVGFGTLLLLGLPALDATQDLHTRGYFQGPPRIGPRDAAVQIKRVAAARGVAVGPLRRLVTTEEDDNRTIDLRALNQALDRSWPAR